MGPVDLVWLVVSVGVGAFLGAFFLFRIDVSRCFYLVIIAKRLFIWCWALLSLQIRLRLTTFCLQSYLQGEYYLNRKI